MCRVGMHDWEEKRRREDIDKEKRIQQLKKKIAEFKQMQEIHEQQIKKIMGE